MKELKKISLKEEIDREARQTEEEVSKRTDLDNLKVSEDMETSLFNKIQDYEYDKRFRTMYRKKKKRRYVVLAFAAVLVLAFGSVITGVGSKSYWKVIWDRAAGGEKALHIDVENMEKKVTEDIDEIEVYKEIRNTLGISSVRLGYLPRGTVLKEYELDKEQKRAILLYQYNGKSIQYIMYMNDSDSSYGQIETDKLIDEYVLSVAEIQTVTVKEYEVEEEKQNRYVGKFEYKDAQYQLIGIMEKEEFEKILENLFFYE